MIFERKIYNELLEWKRDSNGTSALLIKGARRVGKSTLANSLAKRSTRHSLYYYTFPTNNGKHNYEIDFLLSNGDKVDPIEMKSSGYSTHASLDAFFNKFHDRIRQQYLIYTKDLRKDGMLICLPIYMAQFL